jgi:hypothetical protein
VPDRGQLHAAAGAVEQRRADAALQFPDRLADPGRGNVHPLGGSTEMQLLGKRQERFQLIALQHCDLHC